MSKLFISYSHKDLEIVAKVAEYLIRKNLNVWFDKDAIRSGDRWEKNIETSIATSDVFLIFNSENYARSDYCRHEYELAKRKDGAVSFVVIDLDNSVSTLHAESLHNIQQISFEGISNEEDKSIALAKVIYDDPNVKKCALILPPKYNRKDCTGIFNALTTFNSPTHYSILGPLLWFLQDTLKRADNGKYVSINANFNSCMAYKTVSDDLVFILTGANDYTEKAEEDGTFIFVCNLMNALFRYKRVDYSKEPVDTLTFDGSFTIVNNRFSRYANSSDAPDKNSSENNETDKKVYALFNSRISTAYKDYLANKRLDELYAKLIDVFQAVKFYENLETEFVRGKRIEYEINDFVIETSKTIRDLCGQKSTVYEECIPEISSDEGRQDLRQLNEQEQNVFVKVEYGGGTTSLLNAWHNLDVFGFYIDLWELALRGKTIRNALSDNDFNYKTAYKLDYQRLVSYSLFGSKVTLLLDNYDCLSVRDKNRFLNEIADFNDAFKIVFPSINEIADGKLTLSSDYGFFRNYLRVRLEPLDKQRIVNYINQSLSTCDAKKTAVVSQFETLSENDELFKVFDNFTKIKILLDFIENNDFFSIDDVKTEFNSKILVYKNMFESEKPYSISKKIASLFKTSVVDIEDVIIGIVKTEIEYLKKASYSLIGNNSDVDASEHKLRFRDYYPVLSKISGKYFFLNNDIKSYFSASYVYERVSEKNVTVDEIQELMLPLFDEYEALKYLKELDILSLLDLDAILSDDNYRKLALIVYKIVQYYERGSKRREFYEKARFEVLPDKFFFGAENIQKICVPMCVREIGRAVFANMPMLVEINFASKFKNGRQREKLIVKPWAILNCKSLRRIEFCQYYAEYNNPLVCRCPQLRELVINENNPYFKSANANSMLMSKDGETLYYTTNVVAEEIRIPQGVKKLEPNCLSHLTEVERIRVPDSVVEIDTSFSDFCSKLVAFEVDERNERFYSDDKGYLYSTDSDDKVLFRVPSGVVDDIVVADGVNVIGSDSVSCCKYAKRVFVSDTVRKVEDYAFADMYSLETLEFASVTSVDSFGKYIFLSSNENMRVLTEEGSYKPIQFLKAYGNVNRTNRTFMAISRRVNVDDFEKLGVEVISKGSLDKDYEHISIVRDINLYNAQAYDERDLNVLLLGMTEYNGVLAKCPQEAEEYVDELLRAKRIGAILISRDLPVLTQLENEKYKDVAIFRTSKSSTGATELLIELMSNVTR